ncbi:AMP-binding protein [Streptomyces stelliscabiei]|uniref:AMP-binding protein n=1 Tax=Streptomyces stelliscabiei TaxID=146820 RepID=UPI002FF16282
MANLAQFLVETAQREQGRPALRLGDQVIGYTELEERSARAAALLRAEGVRPGDRVALMLPNVPEFVALYYGVLRAGAVVVPMNPLLKTRETEYHLRDSGRCCSWNGTRHRARARRARPPPGCGVWPSNPGLRGAVAGHEPLPGVAETADDDVAVLCTPPVPRRPKGATLTHGGLRHNTRSTRSTSTDDTEDVVVGCLPLFHIFGQICTMSVACAPAPRSP